MATNPDVIHSEWCLGYSPKYLRCYCGASLRALPAPKHNVVESAIPCGEAEEIDVENLTLPMELPPV